VKENRHPSRPWNWVRSPVAVNRQWSSKTREEIRVGGRQSRQVGCRLPPDVARRSVPYRQSRALLLPGRADKPSL
jgi:hypothetical protein